MGNIQPQMKIMMREDQPQMNLLGAQIQLPQPELFIDPLDFFEESNEEDERLGNNTKPCLTNKDFQSLPDLNQVMDPDLPQIPIMKADKDESGVNQSVQNGNEEDKNNLEEEKGEVKSNKSEAVVLTLNNPSEKKASSTDEKTNEVSEDLLKIVKKKEETKSKNKDSFEWNNFLVRRACFRGLSEFYKKKFSKINISWQRKRVNKKKKTPMHDLIKEFGRGEFGSVVDRLPEEEWVEFRNTLYSVLFSHRYKKADDFLTGVDFTTIRGVLYSYTTELRVELMSNPFFSMMMLNFLEKGKAAFIKEKIQGKPLLYSEEVKAELDSLSDEAKEHLSNYKFVE